MHTGVRGRQNAVDGTGMHAQRLTQFLVGEVALEPDPIQLTKLLYHDGNSMHRFARCQVENENISDEANQGNPLLSRHMNRPWLLQTLRTLREHVGTDLALARAIGLRHSGHVPRLLALDGTVPNVQTCLGIAAAAKVHPNDVLRAAGHEAVIPILERTYANVTATPLTEEEEEVLTVWRQLREPHRHLTLGMMRLLRDTPNDVTPASVKLLARAEAGPQGRR